ncbi:hypothetical protein LOC51_00440 [Rubrivivax sp. JA1024]|nr:hypothetical protein [Rubrivivax sp. JA1024]
MTTLPHPETLARASDVYQTITDSHPSLLNGKVWCPSCGRSRVVDAARCLREGWPKCCHGTMSLDQRRSEENVSA